MFDNVEDSWRKGVLIYSLFPLFKIYKLIYWLKISGLYSQQFDRGNVLGFFLVEQRSCSCKSWSWCHNCSYHDNPYQLCQCCSTKDIIHEVNRHLSVCLFLHGFCCFDRICLCWIYRQKNSTQKKQAEWETGSDFLHQPPNLNTLLRHMPVLGKVLHMKIQQKD